MKKIKWMKLLIFQVRCLISIFILLIGCKPCRMTCLWCSAGVGCIEHFSCLQEYSKRERIPKDILDGQGDWWPQFLYDYSISHGPNLTEQEMREFESWKDLFKSTTPRLKAGRK